MIHTGRTQAFQEQKIKQPKKISWRQTVPYQHWTLSWTLMVYYVFVDIKPPIILPKNSHMTSSLIRCFHACTLHQGKGITLNEIWWNRFWMIGGSSAMRNAILSCVKYRKLHCQIVNQNMSNLPEDYVETSPPFTYCALDYFGPFMIKGHMKLKCYKLLFRRASRAINVKTASFLKRTDSFIHPLHFHRHQRPIRLLR